MLGLSPKSVYSEACKPRPPGSERWHFRSPNRWPIAINWRISFQTKRHSMIGRSGGRAGQISGASRTFVTSEAQKVMGCYPSLRGGAVKARRTSSGATCSSRFQLLYWPVSPWPAHTKDWVSDAPYSVMGHSAWFRRLTQWAFAVSLFTPSRKRRRDFTLHSASIRVL